MKWETEGNERVMSWMGLNCGSAGAHRRGNGRRSDDQQGESQIMIVAPGPDAKAYARFREIVQAKKCSPV
jgi:hypothetical protein